MIYLQIMIVLFSSTPDNIRIDPNNHRIAFHANGISIAYKAQYKPGHVTVGTYVVKDACLSLQTT
jgi:hypothetical protein